MEKKSSGARSVKEWVCRKGCPKSKEPCPHLERLLPRLKKNRVATRSVGNIDEIHYVRPDQVRSKNGKGRLSFRQFLKAFNIPEEGITLLESKFVEGMSLREIAKEQGYVNKNTASYYYRTLLDLIRSGLPERGKK